MAIDIPTADFGATPATYTRMGSVMIEPPLPRAPSETPIRSASSRAKLWPAIIPPYPRRARKRVYEETFGEVASSVGRGIPHHLQDHLFHFPRHRLDFG